MIIENYLNYLQEKKSPDKINTIELNHKTATKEQYDAVIKLSYECDLYHDRLSGQKLSESTLEEHSKNFRKYESKIAIERWFCLQDGEEMVGIILVGASKQIWKHKQASIDKVFFRKPYRKKGYGLPLLKESVKWLYSKGAKSIGLGLMWENKSVLKFYSKAGFKPSGIWMTHKEKQISSGRRNRFWRISW